MLTLMYDTGCRVQELVDLRVCDITIPVAFIKTVFVSYHIMNPTPVCLSMWAEIFGRSSGFLLSLFASSCSCLLYDFTMLYSILFTALVAMIFSITHNDSADTSK